MSAGEFQDSIYVSDGARSYRARVQPETLAATIAATANAGGAGPVSEEVSAKMTGGKREIGMIARTVTLRFTGTLPDGYSGDDVIIPVMQSATYNAWLPGATGTYLTQAVVVVGRSPQRNR